MNISKQIVVVTLGDVQYGFPIEQVNEIIRYIPPTQVPSSPIYYEGVINVRGKVHSVIDLRSFLGLEKKQPDKETKIIIANENRVGFIVDEVDMIIKPKEEEIDTNINLPVCFNNNHMTYMLKTNSNILYVLNMSSILNINDLFPQASTQKMNLI